MKPRFSDAFWRNGDSDVNMEWFLNWISSFATATMISHALYILLDILALKWVTMVLCTLVATLLVTGHGSYKKYLYGDKDG